MPSLELGKLQAISAARSVSESDRSQGNVKPRSDTQNVPVRSGVEVEVGASIDVAQPPIDADRVDQIRKAIQNGTYPLLPTKVADAIIAARVGFGVEAG